jgi:hypothetical protein
MRFNAIKIASGTLLELAVFMGAQPASFLTAYF